MSASRNSMLIAVMGATGAGKTTFINLGSESNMRVGYGLESCTSEVQASAPINLAGRIVTLIDTPGFDDTSKSETDILRLISDFLADTYRNGRKLNGIIFVHRISDKRMGGVARKNFRLFRKLCGEDAMKNVIIVTNMWRAVSEDVGVSREKELAESELFFKPALEQGSKMMRHDNTAASARRIIQSFFGNRPEVLSIQREVVDEQKKIWQTAAGQDLQTELEEQMTKHKKELQDFRSELEALMAEKDQAHHDEIKELNDALTDVTAHLAKVQGEYHALREERHEDRHETEKAKRLNGKLQEKQADLTKVNEPIRREETRLQPKVQDVEQRVQTILQLPEAGPQPPPLATPEVEPQVNTNVKDAPRPAYKLNVETRKKSSWCIIC